MLNERRTPRTLMRLTVFAVIAALGFTGLVGVASPASAELAVQLDVLSGTVGVSQTVSATVSNAPEVGAPSGTVNFLAAGKSIGSQKVGGTLGATAEVSWIPAAAGDVAVEAVFTPDEGVQVRDSKTVAIAKVDTATTTTTPGTATTSTAIDLIATVGSTQGQYVPTGTVTFLFADGSVIGSAGLSTKGQAKIKYTTPSKPSTLTIYATYAGDGSANASRSANDTIKVTTRTSSVALVVPQTNYVNTKVTVTAKITPDTAGGKVDFLVNNKFLASANVVKGNAAVIWVPAATGTFTLAAKYSGDGSVSAGTASNKVTVSQLLKPDQITVDPVGSAGVWVPGATVTLTNGSRVQLAVSAASRNRVTLRTVGPCSLDGSTLQVNGVGGACVLTASTTGGNGYSPVSQSYTVLTAQGTQTANVRAPGSGTYRVYQRLRLNRISATTNIGQQISWRVTKKSKRYCKVYTTKRLYKVKLKRRGTCKVRGYAPPVPGQWTSLKVSRTYRIR